MYSNYSRFQYLFFKKQNEIIKKTQEEHGGILSTVTSIQIGRGRSWRVSTDEPFGDFQEIKTLFTFPVTYHMAPEKNEFDLHMRRMRRW